MKYLLIVFFFCSCVKYNHEQIYTIKKGNHKSVNRISRVHNNDLWFQFTFTENHRYLNEIPDDQNRLDINKLYGLTSSKIHNNSCRIGWRELENGNFEILAYWYTDGTRGFEHLYEAEVGELLEMIVTNFDDYRFYCNGEELIIQANKFKLTYRTYPYFGGQNTAPHEIYFSITEF